MPNNQNHISLKELQSRIRQALEAMPDTYWVTAEINELRETAGGHCFMELVQKSDTGEHLEAKAGAVVWASAYRMLKAYFVAETRMELSIGMKVLVRVAVQYHELYGLRLSVLDIDAAYTMGEVALQRRKAIAQLQADGVFNMNRELPLPLLPQRIAIISSEQAAGYGDFMRQLHGNSCGYAFRTELFQATMQGNEAEPTIVEALEKICRRADEFDAVAILRGGGSQSDLACFDSYRIASNVAQFPLPVITGIGHDRDVSVVDEVAHIMLKTPTAAAEFLLEKMAEAEAGLEEKRDRLRSIWSLAMRSSEAAIQQKKYALKTCAMHCLMAEKTRVAEHLPLRIKQGILHHTARQQLRIEKFENALRLVNPLNILQRGYSITTYNGKALKSASALQRGAKIETILHDGKVQSEVVLLEIKN